MGINTIISFREVEDIIVLFNNQAVRWQNVYDGAMKKGCPCGKMKLFLQYRGHTKGSMSDIF